MFVHTKTLLSMVSQVNEHHRRHFHNAAGIFIATISVLVLLYYATVLYCCLHFHTRQAKFDIFKQQLDN